MVDPFWEEQFVFGDRFPERNEVYSRIEALSAAARRDHRVHLDIAYGLHPRERLDLFPGPSGAPLVAFIHGGYWRSHDKARYGFVAPALLRAGFSVAVLGYPLAPEWSLQGIVASLGKALHLLARDGPSWGLSPARTYLCGHSAGGHLAALLAGSGGADGCACISGIYDLRPLLRTSINRDLRLDASDASALSPILRPPGNGWLVTAFGDGETSAFIEQSSAYGRHWSASGGHWTRLPLDGANHYTVLLDLAFTRSLIVAAICDSVARSIAPVGGGDGQASVRKL